MDTKTLSAAQIRYLKIGPRANQSKVLKQQIIQAIQEQKMQEGSQFQIGAGNLNRIPKYGYSQLSKTVNNFGVLINHNFGNSSTLHQIQKFGKLARQVDNIMQTQKDRPLQDAKKYSGSRINQKEDKRTFVKSIYNYQGQKLFAILHSFSIEAIGQNYKENFPFSIMKLLVSKVGSAKLSAVIESALRFQTETVQVNYDKIRDKVSSLINSEDRYQSLAFKFEKIGTQFKINLPHLQLSHIESGFKIMENPSNKDILDILNQDFDNVHDIVYKYFDHEGFSKALDLEAHTNRQTQGNGERQEANISSNFNQQHPEQPNNEAPGSENDSDAQ